MWYQVTLIVKIPYVSDLVFDEKNLKTITNRNNKRVRLIKTI